MTVSSRKLSIPLSIQVWDSPTIAPEQNLDMTEKFLCFKEKRDFTLF